ncbi:MAG: histidine--tRNA ligase [Armatimonadetes bacterium]|nr:histidine--tRNA ligase [Armatimonadota bacterium]
MSVEYSRPRGTHDVLPDEVFRWQHVESAFAGLASRFGYSEIRTPTFEPTDLFTRTSGDTSDIVTKQMYTFTDKGDRSMTLKPEATAPAMRAYLEGGLAGSGQIARLWYNTRIYRYERPQKGRHRESYQVGVELIGSSSPSADAEVIELTVGFYEEIGLSGVTVKLNCIGKAATREKYGAALLEHADAWLKDQDQDIRDRAEKNPLRLLDSKSSEVQRAMEGAPLITDYLEDSSRQHFEQVQSLLSDANVSFELAPEIVRGLDYYTDTVFEVQDSGLGAQNALCGGGRYDGLVADIGGPDTPSVGVAMGIERALMAMEGQGVELSKPRLDVYLVAASESAWRPIAELARACRAKRLSASYDLDHRPVSKQFKQADRAGARFAIVIGDDELSSSSVTLRDLDSREQSVVPLAEVIGRICDMRE